MRILTLALAPLFAAAPAGAQWTLQHTDSTLEFRGLVALSPTVVWASGTRGRVAHTADGGQTWTIDTVPGAARLDLRDIHAVSATHAWTSNAEPAERGQASIFATQDGTRWIKQFTTRDSGVFFDALKFWDDRHGIVLSDPVGGRLWIATTDDGGATWTRVPTENAPPVLAGEGAFAASGTCLAVEGSSNVWIGTGGAAKARVFRSSDRGRTWTVADTPLHAGNAASGIFSVAFRDSQHGIVVGGEYSKPDSMFDNVAVTSDGGRTWRLAKGPLPRGYMSGVAFIPGTGGKSLVAVGLAGTATSTDGGESWQMVDRVAYNSVAFASRDAGWAVGPRGRIARWTPSTSRMTKP